MFHNRFSIKSLFRFILAALLAFSMASLPLYTSRADAPTTWTVNSLDGGTYGSCNASKCTLPDAVGLAQSGDTIVFDPALSGTITVPDGMDVDKDLTVHGSPRVTISGGNSVQVFDFWSGTTINLDNLSIINGHTTSSGGALKIASGCTVNISHSSFSGNSANLGGAIYNEGTLNLADSTLQDNYADNSGAGIDNQGGSLSIARLTFKGNSASGGGGEGGGIANISGTASVTGSTFDSNMGDGGGIYNYSGTVSVTGSSFINNTGGGIYNNYGTMTTANSTLTGNSRAYGGGSLNSGSGILNLFNNTFSGNSASEFGADIENDNGGTVNFANNILANPTAGADCANFATIGTNTDNLVEQDTEDHLCSASLSGDPKLDSLADNGGPTLTMALLSGSPAINAGDDSTCSASPVNGVDQRGIPRPQDSHCDIGAYEVGATTPGSLNKLYPTDALTGVPTSPILSWNTATNAAFYEYCYAPASGCTDWTSVGTNTSVPLSGLYPDLGYYWQVRAVAAAGPIAADSGSYWSFTTWAHAQTYKLLLPLVIR